mmetsp:Transcript_72105/g.233270  ORF Transcript_72105/g.233270 Transcript_72105/m.233270 type:complete len:219 (-) Transcript_72105:545-1201(-)
MNHRNKQKRKDCTSNSMWLTSSSSSGTGMKLVVIPAQVEGVARVRAKSMGPISALRTRSEKRSPSTKRHVERRVSFPCFCSSCSSRVRTAGSVTCLASRQPSGLPCRPHQTGGTLQPQRCHTFQAARPYFSSASVCSSPRLRPPKIQHASRCSSRPPSASRIATRASSVAHQKAAPMSLTLRERWDSCSVSHSARASQSRGSLAGGLICVACRPVIMP